MTYSLRLFLVDSDERVYRVPNTKFTTMLNDPHDYRIPRFKGQRIRVAEAVVELRERKPSAVVRLVYPMVQFDEEGQLDRDAIGRQAVARIESCYWLSEDPIDQVVQASSRFIARGSRWQPSKYMEKYIRAAALGQVKCKRV